MKWPWKREKRNASLDPSWAALIDRGALQSAEVTAPAIKKWLRGNPAQAPSVMNTNPSQVFFRVLPGEPDPGAGRGTARARRTPHGRGFGRPAT